MQRICNIGYNLALRGLASLQSHVKHAKFLLEVSRVFGPLHTGLLSHMYQIMPCT